MDDWFTGSGNRIAFNDILEIITKHSEQDGTVYIGSAQAKKLYAINGQTGAKIWEFSAKDSIYSSPAIGQNGIIYFGSKSDHVYAVHGATGQKVWEYKTGGDVYSSPAIGADGTVYIGSNDHRLYAFDGENGQKKWEFKLQKR